MLHVRKRRRSGARKKGDGMVVVAGYVGLSCDVRGSKENVKNRPGFMRAHLGEGLFRLTWILRYLSPNAGAEIAIGWTGRQGSSRSVYAEPFAWTREAHWTVNPQLRLLSGVTAPRRWRACDRAHTGCVPCARAC
eukprot:5283644-Pleurochrysis_carterae.AAC.1